MTTKEEKRKAFIELAERIGDLPTSLLAGHPRPEAEPESAITFSVNGEAKHDKQTADETLALDLYLAFEKNGSHFNAHLFRLIHKADKTNKSKLRQVYPNEVRAYLEWYDSPKETDFYIKYNVYNNNYIGDIGD